MAEAEAAADEGGKEADVITVACPRGNSAGDLLLVEAEDGLEIEVEVPVGIEAGQEFEVSVQAALAAMKRSLVLQLEALDREQEGVAARQAAQDFPPSSGELEDIPPVSDPAANVATYEVGAVHATARDAFGDLVVVPQPGASESDTTAPMIASVPQQLPLDEGSGLVTAALVPGDELRSATERLNRMETGELPTEFITSPVLWKQKLEDAVEDAQRNDEQQRRWRVAQQLAHSSVSIYGSETPMDNDGATGTHSSGCGELEDCDIVAHAGEEVLKGVMHGMRVPDRFRCLFLPQSGQQTDSEKSATAGHRRQLAELFAIQIAEQLQRELTEVTVHRIHLENGGLTVEYQTTSQRHAHAPIVAPMSSPGDSERVAGGGTELHTYAAQGDEKSVRVLLDQGYTADTRDSRRRTPLHLAANFAVAKTLVQAGAPVNVVDRQGNTPLHAAVKPQIVVLLLEKGAKINAANKFGSTPLHLAAAGSSAVTEALLNAHPPADVHVRNSGGETPLHMATDAATVRLLAHAGCDVGVAIPRVEIVAPPARKFVRTKEQQRAFTRGVRLAAAGEWVEALRQWDALREGGECANEPLDPANPLWLACQRKCIEIEKSRGRLAQALDRLNQTIGLLCASDPTLLVERAAVLMDVGRLHDAHNDLETAGQVEFILDSGDAKGLSELREELAAMRAAALRTSFGAVHVRGHYTPLHTARNGEVVAALIQLRADVHAQTEFRVTPLHCACDAQAVQELIRAKAHVNASAVNHRTPLHAAAARQHGSQAIVKVLLEHKANPNAGDKYRERPLHLAHDPGVCQLLVEYKAKIDAQDVHGQTALHIVAAAAAKAELAVADSVDPREDVEQRVVDATMLRESAEQFTRDAVQQQHTRMIETLITLGASTKISSKSGDTAPDMALRLCARETARKLGANIADLEMDEKLESSSLPAKIPTDSEDSSQLLQDEQREEAELAHQSLQAERMQGIEEQRKRAARWRGLPEQNWNLGLDEPAYLEVFTGQAFELHGCGKITTKPYLWPSEEQMHGKHLFVDFEGGCLKVALLAHDTGNAIAPFTVANCTPIRCTNGRESALGEPVWWRSSMGIDGRDLSSLVKTVGNGHRLAVRLHFEVENGALFGAYITDAIPQSTELSVPEVTGRDPAGMQLAFDLNEQTFIVNIPTGLKSGDKFTTTLPPRAARRGPPGGLGVNLTSSKNLKQPTKLCTQGFLPLPSMEIVRELVRLGFDEPVSKRAASETVGGGLTAASKWAQQARGGMVSTLRAPPRPLAAGRWRLDSCLAPLDPNRSGYLLLAHNTEPIELALVEEGIGRVVGICVRGGSNVHEKNSKADDKKDTKSAVAKTADVGGIVCTARMGVNSQWFDWASSFGEIFCRRYAAELGQPTFIGKKQVPSVQIERQTVKGVDLPVVLEIGDEVLLKIRLQKLPLARDWPTGEKRTARTHDDDSVGELEDDMILQDTEVPVLIEGWRDLTSQLKKGEGMVVHTPFSVGRSFVSEQLIHKKISAQRTDNAPVEVSSGMAMGYEGWVADPELHTVTEEMPPPSAYSSVRAAQSCTALPAGEYSWPAASTTAGAWCVRVLDDGRIELRYGGASSAGAPAWAAKFGLLLNPDGHVRCLNSHGKLQELHQPSELSVEGSKSRPFVFSPSVDTENIPKRPKQKKSGDASKSKIVAPERRDKPKRSARAVAERLATTKAAEDSAKAAAAFFAGGAHQADSKRGPRASGVNTRAVQQDAEEQTRQQRSFFDRGVSSQQDSKPSRPGGFGASGFGGGAGFGAGPASGAVSGSAGFGGAGRPQAPTGTRLAEGRQAVSRGWT
eukprot:COSAG02_NODE_164_length_32230_cov_37.505587_8_plen_1816_part_00